MKISPQVIMDIEEKVCIALTKRFDTTDYLCHYLALWEVPFYVFLNLDDKPERICSGNYECVFRALQEKIREVATCKDGEKILFNIARDLGIDVPGVVYAVPEILEIKGDEYKNIRDKFDEAYRELARDHNQAISDTFVALETTMHKILLELKVNEQDIQTKSLTKLVAKLLDDENFLKNKDDKEYTGYITNIIKSDCKELQTIRSSHTGKNHANKSVVEDTIYAELLLNISASIALFLIKFYERFYLSRNK